MRPTTRLAITLVAVLALAPGVEIGLAGQETRGFVPADLYRLAEVRDPAISPDGSMLAFTVARPVEGENRLHREVWIQELNGGSPEGEPARFSDPSEESWAPRWSPDGSVLSFVSPRADDPNPIWFLRVEGPGGEAFHVPGVRGRPLWSPEGDRIAYLGSTDGEGGGQIHVVSAAGGEPRRLTELAVTPSEPVWAPDGEGLYFSAPPSSDADFPEDRKTLWYAPLEEASPWKVLDREEGSQWAPAPDPDGDRLAYLHRADHWSQAEIRVVELRSGGFSDGASRVVSGSLDRDAGPPTWASDGRSLLFLGRDGADRVLYRVGAEGGSLTLVLSGRREVSQVALAPGAPLMAFTSSGPTRPLELYVAERDGSDETRVTSLHDALLASRELSEPGSLTWEVEGVEIAGRLATPGSFQPGRSYPLVVLLHDGPHDVHGSGFDPAVQALSAAGFFVLSPDPRGSSGYGLEFRNRSRGEWGMVESDDVLAGIDAALARHPEIDPERVGVAGEGYGGFLTAWLTATSDRFQAAVATRMVADWESWYGTSSARRDVELGLGGPPWRNRSVYGRHSPFSYVQNVATPTLLFHDEDNPRMPATQSEQWFTALRRLDVEVECVRFSASARLRDGRLGPRARVEELQGMAGWFGRWLAPDEEDRRVSGSGPPG